MPRLYALSACRAVIHSTMNAAAPRAPFKAARALMAPNDGIDDARFVPSSTLMTSSSLSTKTSSPARSSAAPRVRVFEKLASAVAINAVVARFENLAGRAAMISFLLAAGLEAGGRPLFVSAAEAASVSSSSAAAAAAALSTSSATFSPSSPSTPLFAAGLALAAALAAAAGAAAAVRSRPGDALLEPVVVSLTGAQRALGAISVASLWAAAPPGGEAADEAEAAAAVDWAVDAALDKAFGAEFLAAVLGYGDEDVLA